MRKKILIVTTGGTIAMKKDEFKGVVPADDLVTLLEGFPQLNDVAEIQVFEFSNIPSPHMTPEKMLELAKLVALKIVDYDGIVITHGTDTLEETAYFLELVLLTQKPVVMTAAMRSGSDLGLDGPRNIVGAVRVASSEKASGKGVMVVMNDEIHSARDVIKRDTGKVSSFESPDYGMLGNVDPDKIIFYREVIRSDKCWTDVIDTKIDLIRAASGMDSRFIDLSVDSGAKAIVIEAFGRGNVPIGMVSGIKRAIEKDVLVLIVSRAYTGRVIPEYGYAGGGMSLKKMGAILGGDLKGHKARIKLMVLFGRYKDVEIVKKFIKAES